MSKGTEVIKKIIRWSISNRFLVLSATLIVMAWGIWALFKTPLDAIPDLSDVQVILRTTYPGQAPKSSRIKSRTHSPPPCFGAGREDGSWLFLLR
jgi:hypothetical protein